MIVVEKLLKADTQILPRVRYCKVRLGLRG